MLCTTLVSLILADFKTSFLYIFTVDLTLFAKLRPMKTIQGVKVKKMLMIVLIFILSVSLHASAIEAKIQANAYSGEVPFHIELDVDAQGGNGDYTYVWTSGDGIVDYETKEKAVAYTFENVGDFHVILKVKDSADELTTIYKTVHVNEAPISGRSYVGGSEFPTAAQRQPGDLFKKEAIYSGKYLSNIASYAPNKLSWEMYRGQSGYTRIFMPPGVTRLAMGINSESLAASQSIYFKDMGEGSCDREVVNAPDYESDSSDWLVFTGSRNYSHVRDSLNIDKENCVLFAYYNRDNMHTTAFLQDLSFTYVIEDMKAFEAWLENSEDTQAQEPIEVPLNVTLKASNFKGTVPLRIDVDVDASGGNSQYTYVWTSGDGIVNYETTKDTISYVYKKVGTYALKLEVKDSAGHSQIINKTVSVTAETTGPVKTLFFKSYTAKSYPENDPLDGSKDSVFSPDRKIYSAYVKKYYFQYGKPIKDWDLYIGDSAYVKFFVPPGVDEVGISFNDASLASFHIEVTNFGEFDKDYQVPSSFDYNVHTWDVKGANSRTFSHKRNVNRMHEESSLVFAFHDKDNLYARVNLGQFDVAYYISEENLPIYEAWVNAQK